MLTFLCSLPILWQIGLLISVLLGGFKAYLWYTLGVCTSTKKLTGKTVIITGANTGIGKETAIDLAKRGARVILACRDPKKAAIAKDDIIRESGNKNVVIRQLDLASLKSVRKFAADILKSELRLDVLINNAGCATIEKTLTEDGLEYQMQSNHFGHFLLTNLLLVMDVASGEYGDVLPQLVSGIENGRLTYRGSLASSRSTRSINLEGNGSYQVNDDEGKKINKRKRITYGAPFRTQVKVLLERTWRTMWREKMQTQTRFLTHIVFGIFIGLMYQTVGNDASYPFNAGLLAFSQLFIIFTGTMPTVVTFPMERNVLVREHLNHWYSLKAYYLAKLIVDIPFQILFPAIFLAIVYLMTDQPMCMMRFSMLLLVTICMSLVAQGIGLVFGAVFDIQTALFLSSVCAIPLLLFNGFCLRFNSIPFYLRWMSYGSLFRHGFEGAMLSVYDYDRPPLNCSQPYCYFRHPHKILETFDMDQSSYYVSIIGLMMYFVVMRIAGYFVLRFKLKSIS